MLKIPIFLAEVVLIRKSMVNHFKRRGLFVYYWVLNTEDEFREAIDLGINGIITDYPTRLINFIENNTEYKKKLIRPK
jgi:glycerophosphoryl diester phosphodiesterase